MWGSKARGAGQEVARALHPRGHVCGGGWRPSRHQDPPLPMRLQQGALSSTQGRPEACLGAPGDLQTWVYALEGPPAA